MIETLKVTGKCEVILRDAKTGRIKSRKVFKNLVVDTGMASIAAALAGNVSNNNGQITYCAVGLGSASPSAGDTQLQTELYRKQVSVRSNTGKSAIFQTFFNRNEANGSLEEAGLFGGLASNVANSGTLFCRLNMNRTKSASDTLTLRWTVTVG